MALALLGCMLVPPVAHADTVRESPEVYYMVGLQNGEWQIGTSTSRTRVVNPGTQMRIPSSSAMTVPVDESFAWLGKAGEARWSTDYWRAVNYGQVTTRLVEASDLAADAPTVTISVSNVVGPGTFAMYNAKARDVPEAPAAIGDLFRWGTGDQSDGAPQGLDAFHTGPRTVTPYESVFGASGMFCFDMTATATLADGTSVTDTQPMRVAVGDAVAADASCGTATNETPQPPQTPAKPVAPTAEVAGSDVTVSWTPPNDRGSTLTGYTVTLVNSLGSVLVTRETDGASTHADFEDLPAGFYRVSVVAKNARGESEASPQSGEVQVGEPVRVVTSGHFDVIDPQVEVDEHTGELELVVRGHHDQLGWMNWDEFVIYSQQSRQLPDEFTSEDDWSFIGEPGQTIWEHPNPQSSTAPWPGLSVGEASVREHIAPGERIGVTYEGVVGIDGGPAPGNFALDTSTTLRAVSKEGLPGGYDVPLGAHEHFGWYFSEPGVYCTAVRIDAVLNDGRRHTDRGLITHVVGDSIDPETVVPCDQRIDYPEVPARSDTDATTPSDAPFVLAHGIGNLTLALEQGRLTSKLLYNSSYRNAIPERHSVEDVIFRGGVWYKDNSDNLFDKAWYALGFSGVDVPDWGREGDPYQLKWNTLRVPVDQIDGDITWKVDDVRGPGEFQVRHAGDTSLRFLDTAADRTETTIYAGREMEQAQWVVSQPGKYCIDLSWSVRTRDHGTVTHAQTLTAVVEGYGFTHDADTLTRTCADGAEPTEPGEGTEPEPEPQEEPWDVPNWAETASGAKVLNRGHVDVASLVESGKLVTKVKDTTTEGAEAGRDNSWVSWHEPESIVFQLLPESKRQIPSRDTYQFLGEPGGDFWLAPETQDPSILWPGWSTEHIPTGTLAAGVDWKLIEMEGPGDFFIYGSVPGSITGDQKVYFNTRDGIDADDVLPIGARNHVHGNWAFTAEGIYCLAFERSATLTDGTALTDPFTLAVAVGETDPMVIDPVHCEGTEPVAVAPAAPAQPSSAVDGDAVTVSWHAPGNSSTPITGYTVQLLGGGAPLVKDVSADKTEVVFDDVPAGVYRAVVVAVNVVGASPASPASDEVIVSDATDPGATVPDAPSAPTAVVDGAAVKIEWTAPADGGSPITSYRVELSDGDIRLTRESAADTTSVTFGNVAPGTYAATVVAINAEGESEHSPLSREVIVTTAPGPEAGVPDSPNVPTATANGSTVTVGWDAPADGGSPITGYSVTLSGRSGHSVVQEVGAEATATVFALVPAGNYSATVVAVNANGPSQASPPSEDVSVEGFGTGEPGAPGDQAFPVPDSDMTDTNGGGVEVPEAATPGQRITVKVGTSHAGEQVRIWFHSTPVLLGTIALNGTGDTQVTIPADATLGDHRIVVQALDGSLIGWDSIKIGTSSQVGSDGEWLATTGADGELTLLFVAAAGIMLLLGAGILIGAVMRRRRAASLAVKR